MVLNPIDAWNAETLDDLVANQWQESMVLEFKRQLGTARGDKKETAKDISAMANTSGGWIVYGIDEQANANGIKVAKAVTPLTDPNTAQRIDDIAAEAIVPPVRYRSKTIPYGAGSCVVLRIEPSSAALHMVHAYDEFRYYRRTELAARPMNEPEVRQALDQIVRAQADGDRTSRELFERVRGQYTPPFGWLVISTGLRDERVDPRSIRSETLQRYLHREFANNDRIEDLGYRSVLGEDYAYDFGVGRDGSLWMKWPIDGMGQGFKTFMLIDNLARLAATASEIWAEQRIFTTASRVALQLECPQPLRLIDGEDRFGRPAMLTESKWLSFVVTPAELRTGERIKLVRTVADRVYQIMGIKACPFFGDDGALRPRVARDFANTIW